MPEPVNWPDESPKVINHRRFLASLNADIERPFMVNLETQFVTPAAIPASGLQLAASTFNVAIDKDLFIVGYFGAIEIVPSAAPQNQVEDTDVNLADCIQLQISTEPGREELFATPITLSQVISSYMRPKIAEKLPSIWRVPASSQISASWTVLPTWPLAQNATRRWGVTLNCVYIRQKQLLEYGRLKT